MNKRKILVRTGFLIFALILIFIFQKKAGSGSFTEGINTLFGIDNKNKLNWCAPHVVDAVFVGSADVPEKFKQMSRADVRDKYCELTVEPFEAVDLSNVRWAPLIESYGATGQSTVVDWIPSLKLFRAGDMPFKSSALWQELQK